MDPKYSMWISTDPALGDYIPKAPINEEAKKHNQNLPGMGGVFNHIYGDLYAYAGNNPVKYTDPDGREIEIDSSNPNFSKTVEQLIERGCEISKDFKQIVDAIKDNKNIIVKIQEGPNEAIKSDYDKYLVDEPTGTIISFDPNNSSSDTDGTPLYPMSSLAHELGHAYLNMMGLYYKDKNVYWELDNGKKIYLYNSATETFAIDIENSIRVPMDGMIYRKSYSGIQLPIKPASTWSVK